MNKDLLRIADKTFSSRLFTGTGKFSTPNLMKEAISISDSELVTVALKTCGYRKRKRSPSLLFK